MVGLRDYGEEYLLNILTMGIVTDASSAAFAEAERFVVVFTSDPAGEGLVKAGVNEALPGDVARQPVVAGSAGGGRPWQQGTAGTVRNASAYTFTNLPPCTITHWGLAALISNELYLLLTGALSPAVVVSGGDTVVFPAGALTITLD